MSDAGLILDGLSATVTVERGGGPVTYDKGRAVQPSQTSFTIEASIQQAQGDDLDTLTEAERSSEAIKIYTTTKLQTVAGNAPADVVLWRDARWRVVRVTTFDMGLLDHYKVIAQRV